MEGDRVCFSKIIKDLVKKDDKQNREVQTWSTNNNRGSNKKQSWLVTLMDKGKWSVQMFVSVQLSDRGPCQNGMIRKRGREKPKSIETQTCQPNTKGDKDKKQSSPVTLTDGLSRICKHHFREGEPGPCNWWECKLGGSGYLGQGWCSYANWWSYMQGKRSGEEQSGEKRGI